MIGRGVKNMNHRTIFHVKKRTLLAVAGFVWLMAGFNVARLGILSYQNIKVTLLHILLSVLAFAAFGTMFFKMSIKHTKRIKGYEEEFRPVWHFFDKKSYLIMAFMMGGGDLASFLRNCTRGIYCCILHGAWFSFVTCWSTFWFFFPEV